MEVLVILSRIPGIAKLLDKLARAYIKGVVKEELGKGKETQEQQIDLYKDLLLKQLRETDILKSQLERVKIEERQKAMVYGSAMLELGVDKAFELIEKKYILLPKNPSPPSSPLALALAKRLGERPKDTSDMQILGEVTKEDEENPPTVG